MRAKGMTDWILRFVKGIFIGSGAILPGVSGGALAAVFGIYEKIIEFIAHITRDFKKNFLYLFPVGCGALFGIFILSFPISYLLESAEVQTLWFFIGCILGVLPSLNKQSAKKGRKPRHFIILAVTTIVALLLLANMQSLVNGSIQTNPFTWTLAGVIIGLGMIVPGLSPSNLLVYLNMYKAMTDGIKSLDFLVIIPVGLGVCITVLALSKLISIILEKAYAGMFHFIMGVVVASTIMIVPLGYQYISFGGLICVFTCAIGIWLGLWMSRLEEKYTTD